MAGKIGMARICGKVGLLLIVMLLQGCFEDCEKCDGTGYSSDGRIACSSCDGKGLASTGATNERKCTFCNGTGMKYSPAKRRSVTCTSCGGRGKVRSQEVEECPQCEGRRFKCPSCGGSGKP